MSFFLNSSELNSSATYKITNMENKLFLGNYLKKFIDENGGDILVLNDHVSPIIIQVVDKQKYLYEQKKAKKDQEKKQKASSQKLKEVKFHISIAENDKNTKIKHIKEFLDENCKVKVSIDLRGRENAMKDMAKDLLISILDEFKENSVESIKEIENSLFTFITK